MKEIIIRMYEPRDFESPDSDVSLLEIEYNGHVIDNLRDVSVEVGEFNNMSYALGTPAREVKVDYTTKM